jgi:ABC-type nitrate/sulfonate/bicarbonate transport system ATPase subunit
VIKLQNISLNFGGRPVFTNVSLEIPTRGVTVFRGPSGAGKTTLFRLLLGLQKPDCGTIEGFPFKKPAVVFQEDRLLPWTSALENAALVSNPETAEQMISELGLCENLCQLPRELSGGMRRRVALARALSYGGDALFLDEPFTGLDEVNKEIAVRAILKADVPVYVITHDDAEAALFGAHTTVQIGVIDGEKFA